MLAWGPAPDRGRYTARFAATPADLAAARRLRWRAFRAARGLGPPEGEDADAFDPLCQHVLVEQVATAELVCCFRLMPLTGGDIGRSYSAQFYDLGGLAGFSGPMVEMGRFCIDPDRQDPDILRVAWAAMTRYVDERGVKLLFGCASFLGTETEAYLDAFAMLKERHLAPRRWLPGAKAPDVFRYAGALARRQPDARRALKAMPPLLRTYLAMGGWVSDHAVVDRQMDTLHVFTGLEIGAVPPGRARALRAAAYDPECRARW